MTGPVVIVGAGPVGLTAALLLARRGVDCLVLERHPAPYPLPRAVHLDGEVVRILQEAGVADAFARLSRPMPGLRLVDGRLRTLAQFRRENLIGYCGHPDASMFDQPDLEAVLAAAAERSPHITVCRAAEVTSLVHQTTGVHVGYDHGGQRRQVHTPAVLGCDGANSTVRTALDIGVRDLGFTEPWLVVDVRAPRPLPMWDGVHQVCATRRAATFMHLVDDRYRWEFRILDTDDTTRLTTPAGLAELLAPWLGDLAIDDLDVVRHTTYTFRARLARRWRERHVFLLGDAAHQTPPFIGQGLGSGLRDAHNLVWKLATVLRGGADETLLDTYQSEREPHTVRLIRHAILVGWALTGGSGRGAALRRQLARAVCRLPVLDRIALSPASPRLRLDSPRRGSSLVGRLCPQARSDDTWSDDTLGDGFCLLTLDPIHPAPTPSTDLRIVRVGPDSDLGRWLAGTATRAVLVRPDRVICDVAGQRADIPRLLRRDHVREPEHQSTPDRLGPVRQGAV